MKIVGVRTSDLGSFFNLFLAEPICEIQEVFCDLLEERHILSHAVSSVPLASGCSLDTESSRLGIRACNILSENASESLKRN